MRISSPTGLRRRAMLAAATAIVAFSAMLPAITAPAPSRRAGSRKRGREGDRGRRREP